MPGAGMACIQEGQSRDGCLQCSVHFKGFTIMALTSTTRVHYYHARPFYWPFNNGADLKWGPGARM